MPLYDFLNEETNEVKTLFFHMNDEKRYVDENGHEWTRIFSIPQHSKDAVNYDPFDSTEFKKKLSPSDTLGSMWDRAREYSEKRKKIMGYDPIKERYKKEARKKRKNRIHPNPDLK